MGMKMFIPITKVDEEKRLVYGIASAEVLDHANEIMDYESSKPYFQAWSDGIKEISGGKSLGNVREMHSNISAGKLTELVFNDEEKQVEVCAKVVDDKTWQKVQDGVLNGYSIGGSYAKVWNEPSGARRFTADPAEVSLVDSPCCPAATFTVVKANGLTEQREFKKHKEANGMEIKQEVLNNFRKALQGGDLKKAFSFDEIREFVREAIRERINENTNPLEEKTNRWFWIRDCYPDHAIVSGDFDGDGNDDLYSIPYTIDEAGNVTIGDDIQQVKLKTEYVPVADENAAAENADGSAAEKADGTGDLAKADVPASDEEEGAGEKGAGEEEKEEEEEEGAGDSAEKAVAAEPDLMKMVVGDLVKAGAKYSAETMKKLSEIHHAIAVDLGTPCKCDKCSKLYKEEGLEEVDKADGTGDLAKATASGEPNQEDTEQSVHNTDPLNKAMDTLQKLADRVEALEKTNQGLAATNEGLQKRVQELEAQPEPGGAKLIAMEKGAGSTVDELAVLTKARDNTVDPVAKRALSDQIALISVANALKNPINFG